LGSNLLVVEIGPGIKQNATFVEGVTEEQEHSIKEKRMEKTS